MDSRAASSILNHLAGEKSPYLQQHADNPVDWHSWSDKAFAKARSENKPIFLSIGYSTCHWCHVMSRESFSDPATAEILNRYFVSIKVDREERPDVDAIYMKAVMLLSGSGGWPVSLFLTTDKIPFAGGTYYPLESRWGKPAFKDLLLAIREAWDQQREKVIKVSGSLQGYLEDMVKIPVKDNKPFDPGLWTSAYQEYFKNFDWSFGGWMGSPKFPNSQSLSFLLRFWYRTKTKTALDMVEKTLTSMALGGIYDQIGGGFHRYSVDERWFLPHFEKMLSDQAMLARVYLETFQATGKEFYKIIAQETLDYVLREMEHPEGGFYTAEDADSLVPNSQTVEGDNHHQEGAFYLWQGEEVAQLLDPQAAAIMKAYFGISAQGNIFGEGGDFSHQNLLFRNESLETLARKYAMTLSALSKLVDESRVKMFLQRKKRERPGRDEKILVDINGLMISTLALASMVTGDVRYRLAAQKAAHFISQKLTRPDGRLWHCYRGGEPAVEANLDDYAFLVNGLIELYEASYNIDYLREARRLSGEMVRLFSGSGEGGLYYTAFDAEPLLVRSKDISDGALPSGNAVAGLNFIRLAHLFMDMNWQRKAEALIAEFLPQVRHFPTGYPQFLITVDAALGPAREIVIAGEEGDAEALRLLAKIHERYLPHLTVIYRPGQSQEARSHLELMPFLEAQPPLDGRTTVYVCEDNHCRLPMQDFSAIDKYLDSLDKNAN